MEEDTHQPHLLLIDACNRARHRGLSYKRIHRVLYQAKEQASSATSFVNPPPPHPPVVFNNRLYIPGLVLFLFLSIFLVFFVGVVDIGNSFRSRRCLLPSHPLLMEMVRPLASCNFCAQDELVELFDPPSSSWFRGLAYRGLPIIVRNYSSSTNTPTLDIQSLTTIMKEETDFWDEENQDECQFLPFRSPFVSLRGALEAIPNMEEWGEPWYIGWSNCHPGVATKLRSLIPRPSFLPEESESSAIDWIFIGSPGLGAAMHIDYVRRPSWQLQLSGVKTWELRPPPECETYCPPSINFTIHPGDLLFLETNTWYHQTFVEGNQLSLSIGSEYD